MNGEKLFMGIFGEQIKNGVVYGFDIQGTEIVGVKLLISGGKAQAVEEISTQKETLAKISESAKCAAPLLTKESVVRRLSAPFKSVSKSLKVMPSILDLELPFPLEDCICEFVGIESDAQEGTSALAVTVQKRDLQARLDALIDLGLDPSSLDSESLALWRQSILEHPVKGNDEKRIVVYLGMDRWTVATGTGKKFHSAHGIRPGDSGQFYRVLMSVADHEEGVQQWCWAGPGVESKEFETLKTELTKGRGGDSFVHEKPRLFLARALAMGLHHGGTLVCNLRSNNYEQTAESARRAFFSRNRALLVMTAGILALLVSTGVMLFAGAVEKSMSHDFTTLVAKVGGRRVVSSNVRGEQAVAKVKEEVARQLSERAFFISAYDEPLAVGINKIVKSAVGAGLKIATLSMTGDDCLIRGVANSWEAPSALLRVLLSEGYDVSLERHEQLAEGKVEFTITAGGHTK